MLIVVPLVSAEISTVCYNEKHSLINHEITCDIISTEKDEYLPHINLITDDLISDYSIEYLETNIIEYEKDECINGYEFYEQLKPKYICLETEKVLHKQETKDWKKEDLGKVEKENKKEIKAKDRKNIKKDEIQTYKYKWKTPISKGIFGSSGQWQINPERWWSINFERRKLLNVTQSSGFNLTSYTLYIMVEGDSDMNSDFSDIRFSNYDGTEEMGYMMDFYNSTDAMVYVMFDELTTGEDNLFYLYYKNGTSISSASDGEEAFYIFDDFEDGTIDTNKWAVANYLNEYPEEVNGDLNMESTGAGDPYSFLTARTSVNRTYVEFIDWMYEIHMGGSLGRRLTQGSYELNYAYDGFRWNSNDLRAIPNSYIFESNYVSFTRTNLTYTVDQYMNISHYENGVLVYNTTLSTNAGKLGNVSVHVGQADDGNDYMRLGEIRVRGDYVYPEPTYEFGTEEEGDVKIGLNTPTDESVTYDESINFICNVSTVSDYFVSDLELHLWNSTDEVYTYVSEPVENLTYHTLSQSYTIPTGELNYTWNCEASVVNNTGGTEEFWADTNNTFAKLDGGVSFLFKLYNDSLQSTTGYWTDGVVAENFTANNITINLETLTGENLYVRWSWDSDIWNYTQFYDYIINSSVTLNENMTIMEDDNLNAVYIKVIDEFNNPVDDVLIRVAISSPLDDGDYEEIGQRYTGWMGYSGITMLYIPDDSELSIRATKDNYDPETIIMNIQDTTYTLSSPLTIKLESSEDGFYNGAYLLTYHYFNGNDTTIPVFIYAPSKETISYNTSFNANLFQQSLDEYKSSQFNLERGVHYSSNPSEDLTVYFYIDDEYYRQIIIPYLARDESKFNEPDDLNDDFKEKIGWIGLLACAGLLGLFFKSSDEEEGNGVNGKVLFLIGCILMPFLFSGSFLYLSITGVMYFVLVGIRKWISE